MTQWVEVVDETNESRVPCQGTIELPVIQEGQCTTPVVAVAVANSMRTWTSRAVYVIDATRQRVNRDARA